MPTQPTTPGAERLLTILTMLVQSTLPLAKYIAERAQPGTRAKFRGMVGTKQLTELIDALQKLRR